MGIRKLGGPRANVLTTPDFPIPGRAFRFRVTPQSNTTGTHCRIWCLAAPPGTKLRQQLDDSRADRISLVPLLRFSTDSQQFQADLTLEKGGAYVLQVDEILVGNTDFPGFTGGYESDPRGAPGETIKSIGITTLYVAQPLTTQLGCGSDVATLKLYVYNDTVIQTELAVHGETTPRIDLSSSATSRARLASENSDVRDALAGLAGQTAVTLVGNVGSSLDGLVNEYNAHLAQSGRHYSDDADNAVSGSFLGAQTAPARAATLNELRRLLSRHERNDNGGANGSAAGTGSAGYHSASDWQSLPLDSASPSDALNDTISHADAWRAYEAHRISAVHAKVDNVNKAAPLPPLLNLHQLFLSVLAQASAPTPVTGPSGSALLISQLGFKEP